MLGRAGSSQLKGDASLGAWSCRCSCGYKITVAGGRLRRRYGADLRLSSAGSWPLQVGGVCALPVRNSDAAPAHACARVFPPPSAPCHVLYLPRQTIRASAPPLSNHLRAWACSSCRVPPLVFVAGARRSRLRTPVPARPERSGFPDCPRRYPLDLSTTLLHPPVSS